MSKCDCTSTESTTIKLLKEAIKLKDLEIEFLKTELKALKEQKAQEWE